MTATMPDEERLTFVIRRLRDIEKRLMRAEAKIVELRGYGKR